MTLLSVRRTALGAALLVVVSLVGIRPASSAVVGGTDGPAYIDPALAHRVTKGTAVAIIGFDESRTSRSALLGYLHDRGIQAHAFSEVPVAYACAGSLSVLNDIAQAPGARSVYADAPLTPALDKSVRTAFNGDPRNVWQGLGVTGKGVGIAILDTGIDGTHPDLKTGQRTKVNARVVFSHADFQGPANDPCVQDRYVEGLESSELTSGHGTHIASVAAGDGLASGGRYTGVAPGADLFGIAVDDTFTPYVDLATVQDRTQLSLLGGVAGINFVINQGLDTGPVTVKVILAGWVQEGLYDPWHPMADAIETASLLGISVVFPAGNEGPTASNCSAADTCHYNAWGADPFAIDIAATPKLSRTTYESYSSKGDPVERTFHFENFRYEPLLAAPGTGVTAARATVALAPFIQVPGVPPAEMHALGGFGDGSVSLDRRYVGMSGTSVSAAHVAGAIALMQEAARNSTGCYLRWWQVRDILTSTATPITGAPTTDVGAGAVDITAAVSMARSTGTFFSPDIWMCPGN